MTGADILVLLAAASAIAVVNWYFLFGRRKAAAAAGPPDDTSGVQTIRIEVAGGYSPDLIEVTRGAPVRLIFDRRETNPCSEEVVLGSFGIRRYLPAHQQTTIDLMPDAAGRHEFTCGMGMMRGAIIVK